MLVFEIIGRRRNLVVDETRGSNTAEGQEWYPKWVWMRLEHGRFEEVMAASGIGSEEREKAERMCMVALWCIQYQPEARPAMNSIVRMLEGEGPIARPVNPFAYMANLDVVISDSSSCGVSTATATSGSGDSVQSTTTRHDIRR
uniref:Serine-threonine/tyrosine-protein kinase catalytic domain-containing protein n=1 Tax=Leersia perrieri TaxID=77586 RepID=A0A0D9WAI4_9ORYZ